MVRQACGAAEGRSGLCQAALSEHSRRSSNNMPRGLRREMGKVTVRGRMRPWPAVAKQERRTAFRRHDGDERRHELSILIGPAGRARGEQPRSNVSMMAMRPPQRGHEGESVAGSVSLSARAASFRGLGAASNSRARMMFSARPPLANSP